MLSTRSMPMPRGFALLLALAMAIGVLVPLGAAAPVHAAPTDLFFSEYIEGTSNNKALEIYNGTGAPIDLTAGGYNVQMHFNGNPVATLTINLTGTVASGDVFVLAQSAANATILAQADQTNGSGWFNGDDAVVLRHGTTVIDVIGQIGFDPGTEWGTGLTSTADNTLRRKGPIEAGDTNGSDVFDPSVEWDGFATDTFRALGAHPGEPPDDAPTVTSTAPGSGSTARNDANIIITFNEPVTVSGSWFSIACSLSGAHAATVTGGPAQYTLNPEIDFTTDDSCTVTVVAANVVDADLVDPPNAMAADHSFTFNVGPVLWQPDPSDPPGAGLGRRQPAPGPGGDGRRNRRRGLSARRAPAGSAASSSRKKTLTRMEIRRARTESSYSTATSASTSASDRRSAPAAPSSSSRA